MSDVDEAVEGPLPSEVMAATKPVAMLGRAGILPGKEADFERLINGILPKIRQEDGCIYYTVDRALDEKSTYVLYEVWENGDSILKHIQQPFMTEYFAQVFSLMAPGAEAPTWSWPL